MFAQTNTPPAQVSTVTGTPNQIAVSPSDGNVVVSLPGDTFALPSSTLMTVGNTPLDQITNNQVAARMVIKNSGAYDELYGQDILRLYADYNGADNRPSFRMDSGGHIHITRVVTISNNPNAIYDHFNGQYMLGIESDEMAADPLLVLRPNPYGGVAYDKQPLIYGFGRNSVPSFIVQANGTMGVGNAKPVVSGSGHFHQSGDTIRIVDQQRTPKNVGNSDKCNLGEISFDTNFAYFCVAQNTWKRVQLQSF